MRVKSLYYTRFRGGIGLRTTQGSHMDDCVAWAGDVGIVKAFERPHPTQEEIKAGFCWYGGVRAKVGEGGWWRMSVEFERGRVLTLDRPEDWAALAPVKV